MEEQLARRLMEIFDDEESLLGVLAYVDNDHDRSVILDYIESGENVTPEMITLVALELEARKGEWV